MTLLLCCLCCVFCYVMVLKTVYEYGKWIQCPLSFFEITVAGVLSVRVSLGATGGFLWVGQR